MKFTMAKIAAAVLAMASTGAVAVPVPWGGDFLMFNPLGAQLDSNDGAPGVAAYVGGFIDEAASTFSLASTDTFFGVPWTATGGTLYGEGTHTINVNGDGSNAGLGDGNVTFTVGAGQFGGNINFNWGYSTGIDVFLVWNATKWSSFDGVYTSTDIDGDGIPGLGMVDGPFVGYSASFNLATVLDWDLFLEEDVIPPSIPEASTYAMMLAGLGLVGFMARRRKRSEA